MSKPKGSLIVYSGPSGVGKGTIIAPMVRDNIFAMSVSATTRAPRVGEVDGVSYYFLNRAKFEQMIAENQFLEYAQYNGNYYGTPREFVEQKLNAGIDVLLEIEVVGAMKVKKSFPEAVFIFVMPPSFEELRARLTNRQTETAEQIHNRLAAARDEIKMAEQYDFIIINNDLATARESLLPAVRAAKLLARKNYNFIKEVEKLC